ncbi:MAG: hypothetical protein RR475_02285 [Clostridia bacterium]
MTKIVWDQAGQRMYETGVEQGVLYPMGAGGVYSAGVPWNGITGITESPSGAEVSPQYADNMKYLNLVSKEEFGATIEAFMYPEEFAQCDGSAEIATGIKIGQQNRKQFGMCYKTRIGNDENGEDHGYKLHIIYGALAAPSEKDYTTINESPEPMAFSWEITTTPVPVTGRRPTANLEIDSTKVSAANLAAIENLLYGSADAEPSLPRPDAILALITPASNEGAAG